MFYQCAEDEPVPVTNILFAVSTTTPNPDKRLTIVKNAIKNIIDDLGQGKVRYAFMTFGRQTTSVLDFNQPTPDTNTLKKYIDRASVLSGPPDLTKALQESKKIFEKSGRPNARKILVVIKDQTSLSDPSDLRAAAVSLYRDNVEVIPVFLGGKDNSEEFEKITPDKLRTVQTKPDVYPEMLAKAILQQVAKGKQISLDLPTEINTIILVTIILSIDPIECIPHNRETILSIQISVMELLRTHRGLKYHK